MKRFFYLRLALTNLKNSRNVTGPYLLSCSTIIGLFAMLHAITLAATAADFSGSGTVGFLLTMGTVIAGIVSVLIIFYTNSFLMKRRKRELGLYSVLGLEKKHIARVLIDEVIITGLMSLFFGLLGCLLLGKLLFLVMLNLLKVPAVLSFRIHVSTISVTLALFVSIFFLVMIYNLVGLRRSNPIALLQSSRQGEREPKSKGLLAALGVLTLGGGYGLALWVKAPSDAVTVFFFAVLLVIAGTYLLFTAGSIALLKILRKNKRFYYRPHSFISVSGMIYRMKQNAVGLANICILSTCVLVTLSSTVSLYLGEEDLLRERYPFDVMTSYHAAQDTPERTRQTVAAHAAENGVTVERSSGYYYFFFYTFRDGETLSTKEPQGMYNGSLTFDTRVVPLSDYNRETGEHRSLGADEVLLYSDDASFPASDEFELFGTRRIRERIVKPPVFVTTSVTQTLFLVVPDEAFAPLFEAMNASHSAQGIAGSRKVLYSYRFDIDGNKQDLQAFCSTLRGALNERVESVASADSIYASRDDFYTLYGSLLFLGLFFVTLFALTAVLIMYYKQVTEGYDDHDRFQIMQKVGLSRAEVQKVIRSQVLMVFFLPLAVAVLHISVAFPVLCKMLTIFHMTNTLLFLGCTAAVIVAFAALYLLVYRATARTYYALVEA